MSRYRPFEQAYQSNYQAEFNRFSNQCFERAEKYASVKSTAITFGVLVKANQKGS